MLVLALLSLMSCVFFYVEAMKSGLNAKVWAFAGLMLGPVVLPLFTIHRHVAWRRAVGFNNLYLAA